MKNKKSHQLKKGFTGRHPKVFKEDLYLRLCTVVDFCVKEMKIRNLDVNINNVESLPDYTLRDISMYVDSIYEFIQSGAYLDAQKYCILLGYVTNIRNLLKIKN